VTYQASEHERRILDAAGAHCGQHLGRDLLVTWEDVVADHDISDGRPQGPGLCRTRGVCTYDGPDYLSIAAESVDIPGSETEYRCVSHIIRILIRDIHELT